MLRDARLIGFAATSQPEAAKRFYRDVLGLPLTEESAFALVFDANGTMLRVQKVENIAKPLTPCSAGGSATFGRKSTSCRRGVFIFSIMLEWPRMIAASGKARTAPRLRGVRILTAIRCRSRNGPNDGRTKEGAS